MFVQTHENGSEAVLQMRGMVKTFPGVRAIDQVNFDLFPGEVHALLGENGAGKSTLMKVLYGMYAPEAGEIFLNGNPVNINSPSEAIGQGIGMIHQHFMLVPSLTVVENVALGMKSSRGFRLDLDEVAEKLEQLSQDYNLKVNVHAPIWQLAVGEQQRVEILRALYKGAAVLILDEPTAVLTPGEVEDLFRVLRQMTSEGHGCIFISHKLHEVLAISQRITVLRDGRLVDTIATEGATRGQLAEMMVGRTVLQNYEITQQDAGTPRLSLKDVCALNEREEPGLIDVSLEVRSGEIVGIAGVSGNGQRELAQVIAGLRPLTAGTIELEGTTINNLDPAEIKDLGLSYIPEERMEDGVITEFTVAENYMLRDYDSTNYSHNGIFLRFDAIDRACHEAIRDYDIKTPATTTKVKSLSGGNIQKLVLARELDRDPRVLLAAQPIRGVDIGATEYIHQRLLDERERGSAILLISEDLDEIQLLSDRILVMYEGRIVGEMKREEVLIQQLGAWMAGATEDQVSA